MSRRGKSSRIGILLVWALGAVVGFGSFVSPSWPYLPIDRFLSLSGVLVLLSTMAVSAAIFAVPAWMLWRNFIEPWWVIRRRDSRRMARRVRKALYPD